MGARPALQLRDGAVTPPPKPSAGRAASWRAATLSPFRHRIFLLIWVASLVSNFGAVIQTVGASWLMTTLAPSPDMVALIQAGTALPIMLLSLPAGAAADVFDRRLVMLTAQVFMLLTSLALVITSTLGIVSTGLLLGLTFLIACGSALNGPAWQSSVGDQVPRSDISAAVSLNALNFNIARSVGPAIGGLLVASFGPPSTFLVNVLSYVALILVLLTWRHPKAPNDLPPERIASAVMTGVRYARRSSSIRRVVVRGTIFGLLGAALWALLPLVARNLLSGGPVIYGLLLGALGGGAILGALGAAWMRQRFPTQLIVDAGSLAFGVACIVAALSPTLLLTMAFLTIGGAAWVTTLSTFNISVQLSVPRWVVGRAVAVYQTTTFGGMAIGSWIWGVVADQIGIVPTLVGTGVALGLSLAIGVLLPIPTAGSANLDPWRDPSDSEEAVTIAPLSGPVVTTLEYRVAEADRTAFAAFMLRSMRPMRERDGALRWTLLQDVAEREIWIERFQNPTWLDYLRQNHRRTVSDHDLEVRALAFHQSAAPPRVRHFLETDAAKAGSADHHEDW